MDELIEAGRIARVVRNSVPGLVRPHMPMIELAEKIESMILDRGGRPAFPCNISVDSVAAHYTPPPGDRTLIPRGSVVKIDIGVVVNGYIADTAVTVSDSQLGDTLRYAAEEALKAAIKSVKAGVKVSTVGGAIQSVITRLGFKPIRNLTGHEIKRYNLHAGVSIPNVATDGGARLVEGHVYAIEPFVTLGDAAGEVYEAGEPTIFRVEKTGLGRLTEAEQAVVEELGDRFHGLPYTLRWLRDLGDSFLTVHGRLVKTGRVRGYPILAERSGRPVAQAEHTIVVKGDGCEVVT
ncbi:MAG: type II methionyl aminopeptidase [Nitrososphaerota archaeon]